MEEDKRTARIYIRLSTAEKEAAERAAEQMGLTISEWVRHMVAVWDSSFSLVGEDERN